MKFHGGYNVSLEGRPVRKVKSTPLPEKLYLPLRSQRFNFTEVCVADGEQVHVGEILAKDPDNYDAGLEFKGILHSWKSHLNNIDDVKPMLEGGYAA